MRVLTGLISAVATIGLVAGCAKGGAGGDAKTAAAMDLGNANAKVTVEEWASVTCPHCAAFNEEVFPLFKASTSTLARCTTSSTSS